MTELQNHCPKMLQNERHKCYQLNSTGVIIWECDIKVLRNQLSKCNFK